MKHILWVLLLVLVSSCAGKIESNIPKPGAIKQEEALKVDVFSLTYHKQLGSCTSLPISHRVLSFNFIPLAMSGDDIFVGVLEVLLDEQTKTYQAIYKEYPGAANTDQNVFAMNLNGTFEVIKAQDNNSNDKLILGNLGEVNPTLKSDRVRFLLKLDSDLNREVTQAEVLGYVQQKGTELVDDNCLL
ncbi:hypothetical protein C0V70_17205 [Bacteriovorax stolpii]|uniref:Uncharacterized protein n=1 Tax=Bacteriovorax stolpii TaxID=960 RepID=A0A2K9NWD6_BACTC|nr:hypothetical protein [Bacteriovorax stolpii]AUN99810.1 hypothetical protein C0V70_17205 [Bacteriovorax stolpii]TDP54299.1 hypothetical protein C8D79_1594 [Bacteriovorax stolpii]